MSTEPSFDEQTTESEFEQKIRLWQALTPEQHLAITTSIHMLNQDVIAAFLIELERVVQREIAIISIFPVHGIQTSFSSADAAIEYVTHYPLESPSLPLVGYQVKIQFTSGEEIDAMFETAAEVAAFLQTSAPLNKPSNRS